jgi:hypothetical protein
MNSFINRLGKGFALTALALSAFFIASVFTYALAETTNSSAITSLPATITTQGIYCLTGDLTTSMTSGNAITINTNNVTIDLNGHKLGGFAAGAGTNAYGIYANQRQNITIRNGTVRGFMLGIVHDDASSYTGSSGHLIEDIRADGNTVAGMWILGTGNIIRNNQVVKTGGSTVSDNAHGILAYGSGSSIMNNDITDTVGQGELGISYGVYINYCSGCAIETNRISNSTAGLSYSYGVFIAGSDVMAVNNRMSTLDFGIYYVTGSTGKYRDNVTGGDVTTPYTGGTDAGNNN